MKYVCLILLIIFPAASAAVFAQADCGTRFNIILKDIAGEPVIDAHLSIELAALNNTRLRVTDVEVNGNNYIFVTEYPCSNSFFQENFGLFISASGFMPTGRQIRFKQEGVNVFEFEMRKKDDFRTWVRGRFLTAQNGSFTDTEITFTAKDGKKLTTKTDARGVYNILLPPGSYRITAGSKFFKKPFKLDNYLVPSMGEVNLDLCTEAFPYQEI